jgi:diacylglycerol kinase family enzyme
MATTPAYALLEQLAQSIEPGAVVERKRMLLIVNPYAATVSDRLRHLVVYALRGRYEVDAIDTQRRDHATELAREAALEGYDVVVAFGGDGTINEAANGLAGSPIPLTCLPGGSTNVLCRMLGIPIDVVDATEHILRIADDWRPRRVALPRVNERYFTFAAGLGLDASVVERVDSRPRLKARLGEWFFTWAALTTFMRRYLVSPPRLVVEVEGRELPGVTAIVQNSDPYTFFNRRPVRLAEGGVLEEPTVSGVVLRRAHPVDMPTVIWRALARHARIVRHRQVDHFENVPRLTVRSTDGRPLPLQVDGDHIGSVSEARFEVLADGLGVVS